MAKKIELLHTTYDESGNIESQEVVHPLTSPNCIIMENGKTLDEVMGDGIATPTLTHEGTSFKVGVGDSNIEVVDGDVAGMTIKGQSYQNILPKPTTLIMETDEKEFKINDKIDSNIIIDDNIAEIATVKGKTIVNVVTEESGSEYTVLGEDLSGQSIVTTNKQEGNIKGVTLQGQTLVNTIQEPSDYESVVIGEDLSGQGITIEQDVKGLEGMTLVNVIGEKYRDCNLPTNQYVIAYGMDNTYNSDSYRIKQIDLKYSLTPNKEYLIIVDVKSMENCTTLMAYTYDGTNTDYNALLRPKKIGLNVVRYTPTTAITRIAYYVTNNTEEKVVFGQPMIIEYQEGMENWDIPYFEGTKYFDYSTPRYINGATLEGQTLVNLSNNLNNRTMTIANYYHEEAICDLSLLSENKTYSVLFYVSDVSGTHDNYNHIDLGVGQVSIKTPFDATNGELMTRIINKNGWSMIVFNYSTQRQQSAITDGYNKLVIRPLRRTTAPIDGESITFTRSGYVVLEGDWSTKINDLPFTDFFEGMQSVKMPVLKTIGKNLCQIPTSVEKRGGSALVELHNGVFTVTGTTNANQESYCTTNIFVHLVAGKNYSLSFKTDAFESNDTVEIYLLKDGAIKAGEFFGIGKQGWTFTPTVTGDYYIRFDVNKGDTTHIFYDIQIEENSTITAYEPYQSNILTVNEPVELRGIGEVRDELNLITGELIQRVEEASLLDVDAVISNNYHVDNHTTFLFGNWTSKTDGTGSSIRSNKLPYPLMDEGVFFDGWGLYLRINNSRLTTINSNGLKEWMIKEDFRIIYPIKTESVKTVDLTVLDQDGNELPTIKLQTPINHITTSSDGLTPVVNIPSTVNYDTIIKPSTQYTLRFNQDEVNTDNPLTVNLGGTEQVVTSNHFTMTTPSTLTHNQLQFSGKGNVVSKVQVIEGNVTGIEYPYFEGMNDVQVFKPDNLFDINDTMDGYFTNIENEAIIITPSDYYNLVSSYIKVKPNTTYIYNHSGYNDGSNFNWTGMYFFTDDKGTVSKIETARKTYAGKEDKYKTMTFTTPSDCEYIRIGSRGLSLLGAWATLHQVDNFEVMKVTGKNLVKHLLQSEYYGFSIQAVNGSSSIINGTLTESYRDYYIVGAEPNTHIKEYFNKMEVGETIHFNSNLTDFAHYIAIGQPNKSTQYYTNKYTKQTQDDVLFSMFIRFTKDCSFNNQVFNIQIEEGSVATPYEPRHEIIVQQDVDYIPLTSDMFEQNGWNYSLMTNGMTIQQFPTFESNKRIRSKSMIKVKPNTTYTLNPVDSFGDGSDGGWAVEFDKNGIYIGTVERIEDISTFTTKHNTEYIAFVLLYLEASNREISPSDLDSLNLILQEVPQEIVLRGIGDVKDELDLTRGEYIQRIGEVVLDGYDSRITMHKGHNNGHISLRISLDGNQVKPIKESLTDSILCDKFKTLAFIKVYQYGDIGVAGNMDALENVYICISSVGLNTSTMKDICKYFEVNPTKIQYVLQTPIIHKVNLTNMNKIPSYSSKTTYTTQQPSDSLIPNITIPSTLNYDVAIKPSTEYTIRANTSDNLTVDLGGATGTLSNGKVTLTTPTTLTHNEVKFSGTGKVKELMVVEGNEIKDNVPFFNGMKDVQMGGIKLVNIARSVTYNTLITANTNKTQFTYTSNGSSSWGNIMFDKTLLKPNTTYTLYMDITTNTSDNRIKVQLGNGNEGYLNISAGTTGLIKQTITTAKDLPVNMSINCVNSSVSGQQVVIQNPMIIEGDWTHLDEIPFIESEMIIDQPIIRSQGSNLLPNLKHMSIRKPDGTTLDVTDNGLSLTINTTYTVGNWLLATIVTTDLFKKLQGQTVSLSCTQTSTITDAGLGIQVFINGVHSANQGQTFTIPNIVEKAEFRCLLDGTTSGRAGTSTYSNIKLELGSTVTTYEPYKHQTLYSNRVIGYEEGCYYSASTGDRRENSSYTSVLADVDGLEVAYVTGGSSNYTFFGKDGVFISGRSYPNTAITDNQNGFIIVPSNAKYMRFACGNADNDYTPYTKATVTGDLPLRSLPNGVCDTLNLVTGEYVQRVGEVVLDGSQSITIYNRAEGKVFTKTIAFNISVPGTSTSVNLNLHCTSMPTDTIYGKDSEGIFNKDSTFRVSINKDKLITQDVNGFKQYLSQNPITVQYELATPIVRKLGFTTKGNYREQVLDGSETWAMDAIDNIKTVRMTKKNVSPLQNPLYDTVLFTDDYHVRARDENHGTYEYIGCIGNGIYINIYQSKVNELSVKGCTQWLTQNPIKVGYITSAQSSESYSNIHKPIFFNDVDVQFLPHNLDIQPQLTLQARTRNSYVMDMMEANTKYSIKLLNSNGNIKIDGISYALANNRTFVSPSILTNKELIISGQWYEPMIIEGDVTGKNLPYFKGILSSYHDVDEIELYSVNKNLFDMSKVEPYNEASAHWWNTIVKENEVVSVRSGNIEAGQFGAYATLDVRPNSTYTLYIEMEKDGEPYNGQIYGYENDKVWGNGTFTGYANTPYHIRTSHNAKYITIGFNYGKDFPIGTTFVSKNMRLYLGEESPVYIPHSHSTTLIKMPTRLETVKVVRPVMEEGRIDLTNGELKDNYNNQIMVRNANIIPVQPNDYFYCRNGQNDRYANIVCYDINKNFICYYTQGSKIQGYLPNNCYFINFYIGKNNYSDLTITIQRNKPIQLNSLPNGICDEIIMKPNSNKAQLVQRVGKVVLDNSLGWTQDLNFTTDMDLAEFIHHNTSLKTVSMCDDFIVYGSKERIVNANNTVYVRVLKSKVNSLDGFIDYVENELPVLYYELTTPIIHEIQLKGYPHVYENGTVTLNTDVSHKTVVSYNVDQEQLITNQNETIIRHDKQIDDLYYYIELYLEEIYQMELFRMQVELSL